MTDRPGHPDTEPRLPHVNPEGPELTSPHIPGPPAVPSIQEISTLSPRDSKDGGPRASEDDYLTGVRSLIEGHEQREMAAAQAVEARLEQAELRRRGVEEQAARERASIHDKIDKLPTIFREAAASVADKFLEPIGTLIKNVAELQELQQMNDLRWKAIDKLKLKELREQHDKLSETVEAVQRELEEVRERLDNIKPPDLE